MLLAAITEPQGCRLAADFLAEFLGDGVDGPLRVVEAPGHTFADARRKPNATTDKYVSLINGASITALERAMGVAVDPIRFRANVYFDGKKAWRELDWVGSEITLGAARLRVISRDNAMRGNPGQSGYGGTRPRHRRRARARLRPHQHGRLCRGVDMAAKSRWGIASTSSKAALPSQHPFGSQPAGLLS